ncbi:MAG: hypothetical protein QW101_01060 [Ignisphaera sp.]|uniref:Uncharacterized protein n=1 Tax=Ignisphaera aggregans TaxID=334771 RepID=A0A7J3N034_9CREN
MNIKMNNIRSVAGMYLIFIVLYTLGLSLGYMHAYNNIVEGDFSIVWYSKNILHFDEFYVVAPNFAEDMSLIYGKNIVCKSLSIAISSLGVYAFHTVVNGSEQYVHIEGGVIKVQLTNIDTREIIMDEFPVPGLYAIYISIIPSVIWIRDPTTGITTRMQRVRLYVEGYGSEDIRRTYNISNVLPVVEALHLSSTTYRSINAINNYITIHIEYLANPHNVLVVFTPSTDKTWTATLTSVITKTVSVTFPVTTTVTLETTVISTTEIEKQVFTTSTAIITVTKPITTTIEKTTTTIEREISTIETVIEKSTTITHVVEKGYSIYTLIGVAVISIVISITLALLLTFRKLV